MLETTMLALQEVHENLAAIEFCRDFNRADPRKRYLFGTNSYAKDLAQVVEVAGFVDDFTKASSVQGKPVIKTNQLPADSLVVSAVVLGRPLSARRKLAETPVRQLDYFSFYRYSGLPVKPVMFWDSIKNELDVFAADYQSLYGMLSDRESKETLEKLLNFRLSDDLSFMEGFTDRQEDQYFEDFLKLNPTGEVFVDAGGFDGATSVKFMEQCPNYRSVYLLEPEQKNMVVAKAKLQSYANVHFVPVGLSNRKGTVRFSIEGSASAISDQGEIEIQVDKLDSLVQEPVTFIKMDIEGAESDAINGARQVILNHHPRLAIAAYHKAADLRMIPEQVLGIRKDYSVYLRHYTEGVTESVMFFIPSKKV